MYTSFWRSLHQGVFNNPDFSTNNVRKWSKGIQHEDNSRHLSCLVIVELIIMIRRSSHWLPSISAWDTLKIGVHSDGIALCKPAKDTSKHHHHHNPLWPIITFNWIQFNHYTAKQQSTTSEILGRSCAGAPRFWLSARKIRDTCHSWQQCTVLTPTCSWSFSCFTLHTGMHWMGQKDTDRMTKFLVLGKQSIWRRVLLLWYNHTRAESAMKKIGRYYWAGLRYLCVRC